MSFNPYHVWLGIPPEEQPPHHYRLLGIQTFETNPDVIASAADRQMAHLRTFQMGSHSRQSQTLLNEIAQARVTLLDPEKKFAYDALLRAELDARLAPPEVKSKPSDPTTALAFGLAAFLIVVAGSVFVYRHYNPQPNPQPSQKETVQQDQPSQKSNVAAVQQPKTSEKSKTTEKPKIAVADDPQPTAPSVPAPAAPSMPAVVAAPVAPVAAPAVASSGDSQRAAAEIVFRAKGEILWSPPANPANLVACNKIQAFPAEAVFREIRLTRNHPPISNDDLQVIASIRNPEKLDSLMLGLVPDMTDKGVEHIIRLSGLRRLEIGASKITDAGLEKLTALRNLEFLMLGASSRITNAGMAHYQKFAKLNELWLGGSAFTDEGLKGLRGMNLRVLCVGWNAGITDAGLGYLELDKLEELVLNGTNVREQGVRNFHAAHPGVKIKWSGGEIAATTTAVPAPKASPVAQPAEKQKAIQITPTLLRKKFRGRATYDADSRTLTLFYDFKKKPQLDDFTGNPAWGNGYIGIPTGEHALHVAKFKTVTVSGVVAMKSAKNPVILDTTSKFRIGRNGTNMAIAGPNDFFVTSPEGPPESVRMAPFEIVLTHKAVFRLAGKEIGKERPGKEPIGQIKLCSGDAGTMFSQLTISGEIDPAWAEEFFAPDKPLPLRRDEHSHSDWPRWRGPNANSVADGRSLPIRWSQTENVRWSVKLPGWGTSSPVVYGGRVFVTSHQQNRKSLLTLCYDRRNGKELWRHDFGFGVDQNTHKKSNLAANTPAVTEDAVYVAFGNADIARYSHDGKLIWVTRYIPMFGDPKIAWGYNASPLVLEDSVLFPWDNHKGPCYLIGLDKKTGEIAWKKDRPMGIAHTTPLLIEHHGQTDILVPGKHRLTAFDARTHTELWRYGEGEGPYTGEIIVSPVYGDGMVFLQLWRQSRIHAIRLTGEGKPPIPVWISQKPGPQEPSLLYYQGLLYALMDNGVLVCLDGKTTGKEQYRQRLGGDCNSTPIASDGRIYLSNNDGTTFVVQAGKEFKLLARNELGERITASPAISGDELIYRTDSHLYCIGS